MYGSSSRRFVAACGKTLHIQFEAKEIECTRLQIRCIFRMMTHRRRRRRWRRWRLAHVCVLFSVVTQPGVSVDNAARQSPSSSRCRCRHHHLTCGTFGQGTRVISGRLRPDDVRNICVSRHIIKLANPRILHEWCCAAFMYEWV